MKAIVERKQFKTCNFNLFQKLKIEIDTVEEFSLLVLALETYLEKLNSFEDPNAFMQKRIEILKNMIVEIGNK